MKRGDKLLMSERGGGPPTTASLLAQDSSKGLGARLDDLPRD